MIQLSLDILAKYQVRKTREQKDRFIAFLQEQIPELKIEEGGFPRCRNLVLGDLDKAGYILTAHYDTCAALPFPNFIAPKNLLITVLYSVLICIPFFVVLLAANMLLSFISTSVWVHELFSFALFFLLFFMVFIGGPANKHTANDNTSGVITLCELICSMSPEERAKTAFVFFDHEESGLFGSTYFRKRHKGALKDKLIINFDCVSDGDHILLVKNKAAGKHFGDALERAFAGAECKTVHIEKSSSALYPSDQVGFPCAVAVAAMHKKPLIGLCLGRIHSPRDTVFDESNIRFICAAIRRFYVEKTD